MLTIVFQFMHFLLSSAVFLLNTSFHIGRAIFLLLIQVRHIIEDILFVLVFIGVELYSFVSELNISISVVSNTRMYSNLLATQLMCFVGGILNLIKNALLLISDCAWCLIILLPRCVLYAFIAVIGCVLTFILWRNRRSVISLHIGWYGKLKRVVRTFIRLVALSSRLFRRRVNRAASAPPRVQRRSPLPRNSISSTSNGMKPLDVTQHCVVCRDRQKRILLLPCKHLCLCDECADYLLYCTKRRDCPLCRTYIKESMSVYL